MSMNVGDKVKAKTSIDGFTKQAVPAGSPGVVVRAGMGRVDVCFTLPGLAGGRRTVEVSVVPSAVVKV
ncbi:hypothetical protein [Streptomyces sp. SID3343]|uniref:hypothetical protein n=1 Tax=Streptomyces sp. SID3343 TaxID=2690260 RepID=UPI0013715274|nr:hypothetical protein [Streptomyces sp. SID3343]MYW06729.1 hypothetical protein [Streptomyces sp. SID3343]